MQSGFRDQVLLERRAHLLPELHACQHVNGMIGLLGLSVPDARFPVQEFASNSHSPAIVLLEVA